MSSQGMPTPPKVRLVQLDVIRSLAIVLVILVHYQGTFTSGHSWSYAILHSLGELGVPLFVVLSGYLMLGRNYNGDYLKRFLRRNLFPLFIAYEAWLFFWWLIGTLFPVIGERASAGMTFGQMLSAAFFMGDTGNALWFLPMMLGLYLGLPIVSHIIQFFSKDGTRPYGKLLLACVIFFGTIVPTINSLSVLSSDLRFHSVINMNIFGTSVWGASVWIVYLLAGLWIRQGSLAKVPVSLLIFVLLVGIAADSATKAFLLKHNMGASVDYSYFFLLISVLALFELLNRSSSFWNGRNVGDRFFATLARASFGMYMVHVWIGQALLLFFSHIGLYQQGASLSLPLGMVLVALFVALCTFFSWLGVMALSGWGRFKLSARYLFLMK